MGSLAENEYKNQKIDPACLEAGVETTNWDPLFEVIIALDSLPGPGVGLVNLHTALLDLGRYDRGEVRELSGLAAWLDFLRDPWQDDEPIDDEDKPAVEDGELSRLIAGAIDYVREHPEPPSKADLFAGLDVVESAATDKVKTELPQPQVIEMPSDNLDRLYSILEECKSTGKAQRLFEVPVLLAMIPDGQWNDFLGAAKRAAAESKVGLRIDLNALKKARREAKDKSRAFLAKDKALTAAAESAKPAIIISGKQLSDLRTEAVAALQQANDPPSVFRRLRETVRFRIDAAGEPFLEILTWASMRSRLADVALFYREGPKGPEGVFPPRPLCEDLLAYDYAPGTFPVVEAIARTPIVRADGTIHGTPGYDRATRMIYVPPAGFLLPPVPERPTEQDLQGAKHRLLDVVTDFPFEDPVADRANFIGFCITPLVRQLVDVVPMCVFDSPVSGSGKGLLTDVASIIATGDVAAVIAPPSTREEWPKLLFSLLDSGRTFIVFDNLHGVLQSDALEAALTKPLFQSRVLGFSQERIVPNRASWAITGNNVAVSRDMVRRCYRVRIDPRCAQPHLRKNFKHPNLVEHCRTERANLLAALLILIRAWYAAGRPAFGGTPFGTYTQWKELVGGILKNAGIEGFLTNQRKLYSQMDLESEEWETFFIQIEQHFGAEEFALKNLIDAIQTGGIALPREVAKIYGQTTSHEAARPNPYFAVQLGNILRARRGTRFGENEIFLERTGEDRHKKTVLYKIRHGKGGDATV
ncbi:MAG: hypothetical protein ACM336_00030 [Acidobacteriota bacterium]